LPKKGRSEILRGKLNFFLTRGPPCLALDGLGGPRTRQNLPIYQVVRKSQKVENRCLKFSSPSLRLEFLYRLSLWQEVTSCFYWVAIDVKHSFLFIKSN